MKNASYIQDLKSWGLNVVRLGTMWSGEKYLIYGLLRFGIKKFTGLEPREGYYDLDYVGKLQVIISHMRDNGIYVILDMHQDVASGYWLLVYKK